MATFISTFTFTQQGIQNAQETTKRAAALKTAAKKLGIKITNFFWTMGEYDGLVICEAPNAETVVALQLQTGALGNVRTTTVQVFTAAEMEKILSKVRG